MTKRLFVQGLMAALYFISVSTSSLAGIESWLNGTVIDEQGVAVSNASVQLLSVEGKVLKETQPSLAGDFRFSSLILGKYQLSVKSAELSPHLSIIQVASGGNTVNIVLAAAQPKSESEMVVQVKAKRRLIRSSTATSSTEISREQLSQLPQGKEVSLPKLIATTTPGVVQGPFGQTFVRGNHASLQYQIDGIQLPDSPSNTFGQAISPRNIDHMEIITGGIPAEYGQRTSVANIVTRAGAENPEGEFELNYGSYNTFTPHLLYGGSNETGNFHYFLSLNYNRTDRGLDTPQPESYDNQVQGGAESIHNTAIGNSEFAKLDWQMDNENKLSFIFFNSQSHYQIPTFPSSFKHTDPFFQPGQPDYFGNRKGPTQPTFYYLPTETDNTQSEMNSYAQVVWKRTFSERSHFQLAPYYKYSSIVVKNDPANDLFIKSIYPGADPASLAQDRRTHNLGLKGDYAFRPNDSHLIKAGFQAQASRADGTISVQTDLSQPPLVDNSPNIGYFEGFYVQDDFSLTKKLTLNAGLRFDAVQFSFGGLNSSDSLLQPRLGLNYLIADATKVHVFYGKLFQPAPVENLRYQFDPTVGRFTSLDAYDIKAEKDDYYEAGIAHQFADQQVASLNAYYKEGVNILDDGQLLNTSIAQPYNFATGFAYGIEFSVKGQICEDWSEYANYSYSIAKGKGISGGTGGDAGNSYQFMDHVQVHTANLGITYSKNNFWWSTQGLFGSGLRTGANNSVDLPDHLTFDTTVGYQFQGKSWLSQFKVSGDILNIFDNRYPITIANGFNGSHYAAGRQFFIRLTHNL